MFARPHFCFSTRCWRVEQNIIDQTEHVRLRAFQVHLSCGPLIEVEAFIVHASWFDLIIIKDNFEFQFLYYLFRKGNLFSWYSDLN